MKQKQKVNQKVKQEAEQNLELESEHLDQYKFDEHNMELYEKKTSQQSIIPPDLEEQVGELIAAYEIAMDRLAQREKALEIQFQSSDKFLNEQMEKITNLMSDLGEIITEAGAARWRLSAQDALRLGDLQLSTVKKLSEETKNLLTESCLRFERTSQSTIKNVQEAVSMFKVDEFKAYTEQCCEEVRKNSSAAVQKINEIFSWFQWKNMALVLGLSIIAAVVIGLYIDDEWPWELHDKVVKERAAGQALMNAWPHLSEVDHQYLENKLLQAGKKRN